MSRPRAEVAHDLLAEIAAGRVLFNRAEQAFNLLDNDKIALADEIVKNQNDIERLYDEYEGNHEGTTNYG